MKGLKTRDTAKLPAHSLDTPPNRPDIIPFTNYTCGQKQSDIDFSISARSTVPVPDLSLKLNAINAPHTAGIYSLEICIV